MKKIQISSGLLLGAAALWGMAASVGAAAETNLPELFYMYSKDNIVAEYYDADFVFASGSLQQKYYDGFLVLEQVDFGWDGVQELLAIRLKPQTNPEGQQKNTLIAEVYEYETNSLQRVGQYTLAEGILSQDSARIDVFTIDTQSGPVVCCEASDKAGMFADGTVWSLRGAGFDGNDFYEVSNASWTGSAFSDGEMTEVYQAYQNLGLEPETIVWQPVCDQFEFLQPMCSMVRYWTVEYPQISDLLNGVTGAESMQYGQTEFHNYVNTGWENKFPKEFAVPEAKETLAQATAGNAGGYSYGGDYVIPDSSSRYLTEADLQNLSAEEILLARNEIYAKHGRIFNNQALDAYFRSKSWYQPSVAGSDFNEDYAARVFNDFEIKNISTIVQYEKAHGINDFD